MAQIVGLFGSNLRNRLKRDWSNQDIAELYRVEACLVQAGLRIDTERGVADEGDPWFVFCHRESGEVIAHFARIDGQYVIASPALPKTLSGFDLRTIVQQFVAENPVSLPSDSGRRNNVVFHPAALLTIFVATIFLMASPDESFAAVATDGDEKSVDGSTAATGVAERAPGEHKFQTAENAFLVIAAALAVEASHALEQNNLNVFDFAELDLGGAFLDVKEDMTSHDDFVEIGQLGLSDAYASHDEWQGQIETIVEPEKIEQEVSLIASVAAPVRSNAISLLEDKAQPNPSLLVDEGVLPALSSHSVNRTMLNQAETISASADPAENPGLQTLTGGEARIWFDEKAAASGLLPIEYNKQTFTEASFVVKFIESGKIDGDVVKFEGSSLGNEITADQAVWNVIERFRASDDDIIPIVSEHGLILFDQSDMADGDMLELHAWVFDDDTSVTILGHSDTITDVMAGAA